MLSDYSLRFYCTHLYLNVSDRRGGSQSEAPGEAVPGVAPGVPAVGGGSGGRPEETHTINAVHRGTRGLGLVSVRAEAEDCFSIVLTQHTQYTHSPIDVHQSGRLHLRRVETLWSHQSNDSGHSVTTGGVGAGPRQTVTVCPHHPGQLGSQAEVVGQVGALADDQGDRVPVSGCPWRVE
jgi:hypothetical protein